jgi:cytochrome c biogenesis protein CcdA
MEGLTLTKVISLAVVDAINPCALAVLTMMLLSIITYNPKNKKNILLAGLAFTISVFVMYLFYGLVIIKSFQLVQSITNIRLVLYKVVGSGAILLGILQMKDFISYKVGGFGTEMPVSMRPKVKKVINKITSPAGAFAIGLFVTVFLLPCTIGPYIILGGILSPMEILKTMPMLLLYNFIFVLPMLLITVIVYFGISKVEDVSSWKDKNIRILHLFSGLIILLLGIAMVMGWA